ncbi:MAG: Por secretion system protein, partial [Dysgonomonas sp.]
MKKNLFLLLLLVVPMLIRAQIVTSVPEFPTAGAGVTIIFDASQGTGGLKNYTGTVYAHTGVITNLSTTDSDWKHTPTWGLNTDKYKMISLGNNKWQLTISPSINDYYGVTAGETIKKLAFVFRSGEKVSGNYLEGKNTGGKDIFLDVYQTGLNISFTSPTSNQSISAGTSLNFAFGASVAADLSLLVNNTVVKTESNVTNLTYAYTFASTGDYQVVAKAQSGASTAYDTLQVCVPEAVTNESRPSGVIDGINYIDNNTATVVLYAPNKSHIFLIGDFNDWTQLNTYQLKKDGDYWWYTLTGLTPGEMYGFQYLVDDTLRISDAYSELVLDPWNDSYISSTIFPNMKAYPTGKTTDLVSVLQTAKPAYNWEISNFSMPSRQNMVIYELLVRDFTDEKS